MLSDDFDREAGLACMDGDEGLYESVLAMFYRPLTEDFAELPESLRGGLDEAAARQVHSLKGSAGSVGAKRLEASAAVIDRRLKAGDEALISGLADALQSATHSLASPS
jgi:HPt (histidine-containing phosphotransfer) domain-containing protein